MKKITILFYFFITGLHAQTVSDYFEGIRNNAAELTTFFAQMPKGGDLHHHYSGSVYTRMKALPACFKLNYIPQIIKIDYSPVSEL